MILTNSALRKAIREGSIIQKPKDFDLVSVNSIDVAVGSEGWVMGAHHDTFTHSDVAKRMLNAHTAAVRNLYKGPDTSDATALRARIPRSTVGALKKDVPGWEAPEDVADDTEVLLLTAGKSYLLSTLHDIGSAPQPWRGPEEQVLIPIMKAKSTAGRLGLTVSLCAGVGDYGYHSRWALECRVADTEIPTLVPLIVGTVIAQVMFLEGTDDGRTRSVLYGGAGSYQETPGQARLIPKALKVVQYPKVEGEEK